MVNACPHVSGGLLSRALGTTPEFWLNLEATYRLKTIGEASMPEVTQLVDIA